MRKPLKKLLLEGLRRASAGHFARDIFLRQAGAEGGVETVGKRVQCGRRRGIHAAASSRDLLIRSNEFPSTRSRGRKAAPTG